jgi:hypothetical protein
MNDQRITVQIKISPETLALLEMSMTEGDTYDEVIRRLVKTPWVKKSDGKNTWFESEQRAIMRHDTDCTITLPEGLTIDPGAITKMEVIDRVAEETRLRLANLAKAALAVRDDMRRTVDLGALREIREAKTGLVVKDAISVIMKTENVLELDRAVKAVFDE